MMNHVTDTSLCVTFGETRWAEGPVSFLGLASLMADKPENLLIQQPEKPHSPHVHLTSIGMRKEPSKLLQRVQILEKPLEKEGVLVSVASADGSPAGCPALLALAVPVNDVIASSVPMMHSADRCIRGCKVWVLARALQSRLWALDTAPGTDTLGTWPEGKNKDSINSKHRIPTRVQAFPRLCPAQREETPPPSEYILNTSVKDVFSTSKG